MRFGFYALVIVTGLTSTANAAVIFQDDFSYGAGPLAGQGGWTGANTSLVTSGELVPGTGNKLTTAGDGQPVTHSLPTLGTDGTTVWIGFLVNVASGSAFDASGGILLSSGSVPKIAAGEMQGTSGWEVRQFGVGASGGYVLADATVHPVILRIDFGAGPTPGNESMTFYMDPQTADPASSIFQLTRSDAPNFSFDNISLVTDKDDPRLSNTESLNIDRLIIATTSAEVMNFIPEPHALGLGIAIALFCRFRGRR
jgi:hypothetical protein